VKIDPGQRESLLGRLALRGGAARGASPLALAGLLAAAIIVLAPAVGRGQADAPSCAGGPQVIGRQILGTPCADVIVAARGIEEIHGAGGDDVIYATDDVVLIDGGNGDDVMHGELPASLPAGAFLASPPGGSVPSEATALQTICMPYCGDGNQDFDAGPGDDLVFGQRGNDNLLGGVDNDSIYGGTGDDTVSGGSGDDLLSGGFGADGVFGEEEDTAVCPPETGSTCNDLVRGDAGPDELHGGPGDDTVSFATAVTPGFATARSGYGLPPNNGERGVDVSLGGKAYNRDARWGGGQDSIVVEFENVIGSPFSDYIEGDGETNRIDGGGGADVILAGAANDKIYGGADGDHLDGGPDGAAIFPGGGDDYCTNPTTTDCERSPANDPDGGVHLRDADFISVGLMATDISPNPPVVDLYLTASTAADNVSIAYSADGVTFTEGRSAAFDTSGDARTAHCAYPAHPRARARTTKVTCDLPSPLDAIVLAGMNGDDNVTTSGFPETTSLVLLGGEGGDALVGTSPTEDMLVDGPDFTRTSGWGDTLQGFGGVDALLNNDGADSLSGGDLSDLLVSASVCDGDLLDGGPETIAGKNNASWAQLDDSGVSAQIAEGRAGRPTAGGPACDAGEKFDTLQAIDDLEGSNQGDQLSGDGARNYLLGRQGQDSLFGLEGDDLLQTNEGQADFAADCGPGSVDVAWIDSDPSLDPDPLNCEHWQRLLPGQIGEDPRPPG
jgi:Ca2+-binding RTX toxin-like protein